VPAQSATQGASAGRDPGVPVHYVCRVGHVDLPGNGPVQERIKDFLLKGSPVTGPENDCPFTGVETAGYRLPIRSDAGGKTAASGGALSISDAAVKGLAHVFAMGSQTIVTTSDDRPVTLRMTGKDLAFRTTAISSKGRRTPHYYGPVSGTIGQRDPQREGAEAHRHAASRAALLEHRRLRQPRAGAGSEPARALTQPAYDFGVPLQFVLP
jgi:hypothetical protein